MAFAVRNLSVHSYANGMTLWHYKSASDTREQIAAPGAGYFDEARDMLSPGDFVMVSATNGGAMLYIDHAEEDGVGVSVMAQSLTKEAA